MENKGEAFEAEKMADMIYVAVGKDISRSKSTLLWALNNFKGKRICIIHVHEPAKWIPMMGTKFLASQLDEHQVRVYRDNESQSINKLLQSYSLICDEAGVQASTSYIDMKSIEKGIIELITRNNIRQLVMGAAADKHYSKKMVEPKSKKAIYVRQLAPSTCHIWFVCKGNLVCTREGRLHESGTDLDSLILSTMFMSQSVIEGKNGQLRPGYRGISSEILRMEKPSLSQNSSGGGTPSVKSSPDRRTCDLNEIPCKTSSVNSRSRNSSSGMADGSYLPHLTESHYRYSSPPSVMEGRMNEEPYDQLEQAMSEAEDSKSQAFEGSMRCRKSEKDVIDAIHRRPTSENVLSEELWHRKEYEEALARGNIELEKMKGKLNTVTEELCEAQELEQSLKRQIANAEDMVQELERKIISAVELLQKYKNERDELEVKCEEALKVAKELKRKQRDRESSSSTPLFYLEFSLSEIVEATHHFDPSLKIAEGCYGSIYRGNLRHTRVAIYLRQDPLDFQQEVSILSKLRHPNIITLIGACPENWALVYEYISNGSLKDRLNCRNNSPPLSWQTRIRIAAELCSVLIFLHSCNPHSIALGNLNQSTILLDANYVSKVCDFRLYITLAQNKVLSTSSIFHGVTDHIEPEFLATHELTPESDVYSFGIILLSLLTGKSASGIIVEVQQAYDSGYLKDLLDPTAGDWPFVQAKQLAHLALRCCETNRKSRPDLATEASRVLQTMRLSCGASLSRWGSEEHRQIPHYFVCPIFMEIMQDPHVAADGFTYELEALRGWLDSGHDTSPMTNIKLPNSNLVPNRALRSAIQEWQQSK